MPYAYLYAYGLDQHLLRLWLGTCSCEAVIWTSAVTLLIGTLAVRVAVNQNIAILIHENEFANAVCNKVAILPWFQCINGATQDSRKPWGLKGVLFQIMFVVLLTIKNIHTHTEDHKQHASELHHYSDVIIRTTTSQITRVSIVYSIVVQAHIKKYQSSASLAFVRGIHRWPVDSQRTSNADHVFIWRRHHVHWKSSCHYDGRLFEKYFVFSFKSNFIPDHAQLTKLWYWFR